MKRWRYFSKVDAIRGMLQISVPTCMPKGNDFGIVAGQMEDVCRW